MEMSGEMCISRKCTHVEVGAVPRTAQGLIEGAVPRTAQSLPPSPGFFSPNGNVRVWRGDLPHWQQAGVATFVTIRAAGSLPRERLDELRAFDEEWRTACADPADDELRDFLRRRRMMVEKWLDAGVGSCPFASEAARRAVVDSLRADDGRRYRLYAFVVMPNHLHVLLLPFDAFIEKGLSAFKRFSACGVNRANGTRGPVWQREHYDTLIRDADHFRRVRDYIWKNSPTLAWDCYRELEGDCAFRGTAPTGERGCAVRGNAPTEEGGCSSVNCTPTPSLPASCQRRHPGCSRAHITDRIDL